MPNTQNHSLFTLDSKENHETLRQRPLAARRSLCLQLGLFRERGSLCFILYQMADNDLESAIRDDNNELIQSSFLQDDPTVTAWIYFDALNPNAPGYESDFTPGPLVDLYQADGTPATEKFYGSRYLTYDYDMQKMIVETEFEEELNSDSIPVLYDFVTHA